MTLRLGGDGAITGCTSLENPDLTVSGLTISGSFDAEKVLVASGTAAAPSYTFSGDTDNGLYYAGTNSIGLATAGTNAILIDSSGRVGIGTTSPSSNLHIASSLATIRLEDSDVANGAAYSLITSSSNGNIEFLADPDNVRSSSDIRFHVDGSERMRIDSSGRLLIGLSSDVSGSANNVLQLMAEGGARLVLGRDDTSITSGNTIGDIQFYGNDAGTQTRVGFVRCSAEASYTATSKPTALLFGTTESDSTDATERMRIDQDGNVGIGDANPDQLLHITGTSPTIQVESNGGVGDTARLLFRVADTGGTIRNMAQIDGLGTGSNAGALRFYTRISGNLTEAARIDSSGNFGIGTTSPQAITGYTVLTLNNSSQGGAIEFKNNNTSYGRLLQGSSAVILETKQNIPIIFGTGTSSTERMRILATGGLTFNGDTATANALDDYEEGTWTPALSDSNEQATWSFNSNAANYTKVGRLVTVGANCFSIGYSGTPSGYIQIRGLPFTKVNGSFPSGPVKVQNIAFGADSYITVEPITSNTTSTVYLRVSTNNTGGVDLLASNLSNGTAGFTFSITYEVA